MVCIDSTGSGDVTKSKIVWTYDKIRRSMSTPAIHDGLVYIVDFSGFVYCLDAKTGKEQWVHDTKGHIWGSALVADGKVYVGNEDGYLTILPASAKYDPKTVIEIEMTSPVLSTPIAANGVLYIETHTHLFAFQETKE
jgi:outer membrane protein assembly factor BamB